MSLILRGRNPDDLTDTYDFIRFYRASSLTGTYTLVASVAIDTSTAADGSPGYTEYVDGEGTTSSYYKLAYYSSSMGAESDRSLPFKGGTTYLDTQLRRRMRDTNESNQFFSDDEVADFRGTAVKSLWPHTWIETVYEVVITEQNKKMITLTSSIARFDTVFKVNSSGDILGEYIGYYKVGNKVYANYEFPVGDTFRFIVNKKYTDSSECPETFDDYLLDRMQLEAIKTMEMDRSIYHKYTTTVRPEGGNMPSLNRIKNDLIKSIQLRLNEIKRVRKPAKINM